MAVPLQCHLFSPDRGPPVRLICRRLLKPASLTGLESPESFQVWQEAISWSGLLARAALELAAQKQRPLGRSQITEPDNLMHEVGVLNDVKSSICSLGADYTGCSHLITSTNEAVSRNFPGRRGLRRIPREKCPSSAEKSCGPNPYLSSLLCMFCSFSKASFLSARGRTPETSQINRIVQKQATNGSGTSIILIISARY